MKTRVIFLVLTFVALMTFQSFALIAQDPQSGHGQPEPRLAGVHWARGEAPPGQGGATGSPNLTWHGGPIMSTTSVTAIFWGSKWGTSSFTGDKVTGLETFYA